MNIKQLRALTMIVPVAFVLTLEVLSLVVLQPLFGGSSTLRLFVIFLVLIVAILPFSFWVFAVIERQQRDLAQSADLLSSVKDYGIFMLDPQGRVVTWSPGAERLKGYSADEIIGKPLSTFYSPEDVQRGVPARLLEETARMGQHEAEGWRMRRDGSRFWANIVSTAVYDRSGELLGYTHVARDVTERKEAEERIQALNEQLEIRVRDLAVANAEITRRVRELDAANSAITSISSALDLSHVLQNIVDSARDLVQSRYAALGVSDDEGRILQFITSGITPEQRAAIGPLPRGHGLLGVLIKDATPLRIPAISNDPRSHGFPANHPPMTSLLGVPILFQGRPVGDLYLTDKIGAETFSEDDQELLIVLANHAAVAIENARLYEEARTSRDRLQAWSEELEVKVAERTREIERYSRELTTRVLQAQEEERKRLARELHDDTAQSLSTLLINLDLLEPFVPADGELLRSGLDRIRDLTKRTLDNVRGLSHDLRPTILDDFGLIAALRWYADEYEDTFGVHVDLEIEAPPEPLSTDIDLALFRIAQEALTNSGKYAEATGARLTLTFPDSRAVLTIADNGKGFDRDAVSGPTKRGGLGLYGMQERADLLGATLDIDTMPGRGTRVTVSVPLVPDNGPSTTPQASVGTGLSAS
ncbi:MAG TPA: PAS domain S-box protein [Chloroflexota bacterium]